MSDLLLLGSFLRITSWLFSWDTLRFKIIRQQNLGKLSNVISACFFGRMPNGFCLHFVTVPKPVSSGFSPCAASLVMERWVSLLLLSSGKHQGKLPVMPLLEVVKDYHNNTTSEVYDKIPTHLKKNITPRKEVHFYWTFWGSLSLFIGSEATVSPSEEKGER